MAIVFALETARLAAVSAPACTKLQHPPRTIAFSHRRMQLLSFADCRNEVGKVRVRHRVASHRIRGRGMILGCTELTGLIALQVIDLVAIAVHNYAACGSP